MRERFQRELSKLTQHIKPISGECADQQSPSASSLMLAVRHFSQCDYLRAIDAARQGIKEVEEMSGSLSRQVVCALWDIQAASWARLHQAAQARHCGETLIELIEPASPMLADALLQLGHHCLDAGDYEAALRYYESAENLLGSQANPHAIAEISIGKADYLAQTGQIRLAVEHSHRAHAVLSALSQSTLNGVATSWHQQLLLTTREQHAFYQAWDGYCDSSIETFRQLEAEILEASLSAPELQSNLARSLDHQAETLERAQRLPEALEVARRSANARRHLAGLHLHERIPLIHSLVTMIRLAEANKAHREAITVSEEAWAWIRELPDPVKLAEELRGQLLLGQGLALMADGREQRGEQMLLDAEKIFATLVRQSPNNAMYRDAMAKTDLVLGLSLSARTPKRARQHLAEASSLRAWLARRLPCSLHQSGWADALTALAHVELGLGQSGSAHQRYVEAVKLYTHIEILPATFADTALSLSRGLLTSDANDQHAIQETCDCFTPLVRSLIEASDFVDATLATANLERLIEFIRLWLEWFIDKGLPEQIVELLSFAHGRRLASLAHETQLAKEEHPRRHIEQTRLHQLRQKILQLDLEIAKILPSILTSPLDDGLQLDRRESLRRRYLKCRDRLARQGKQPRKLALISAKHLLSHTQKPLVMLCTPRAFNSTYPPYAVVLDNDRPPTLVSLPEIDTAYEAFSGLIQNLGMGRSVRHSESMGKPLIPYKVDFTHAEQALWKEMQTLWYRLLENIAPSSGSLSLITHAKTHNLPWLGSAPDHIRLSQSPSIHLHARRGRPARRNIHYRPYPEQPLALLIPDTGTDPHHRLYHAPLEASAIQATWPGSVITLQNIEDLEQIEPSVIWMIGHGMLESGHPRLGIGPTPSDFGSKRLFSRDNRAAGLFMASTCYLGGIKDLQGEPMGLHPLLWLNANNRCTAGAIAPLDDLGAALMAILFHSIWQSAPEQTARSAFDQARSALHSGKWPLKAIQLLDHLRHTTLAEILEQARQDECISKIKVDAIYPDASPEEVQQHQHEIRAKGRDCLLLWQDGQTPTTEALIKRFSENEGVRLSARIWAWIG